MGLVAGCGEKTDTATPSELNKASTAPSELNKASTAPTKPSAAGFVPKKPVPADNGPATPADDLTGELSKLLNEAGIRYASLEHEYNEHLLAAIDRAEAHLSGKLKGSAPRAMPKLSEEEEYDHIRETIRRWQAKSGKDLRVEIDRLKAEVEARKPGGPTYHPEFHKRFAAVFDSFIPIEVQEMRERRNQAIHQAAKALFDKYRSSAPDLVKQYEATLNAPPYNLMTPTAPESTAKSAAPGKS